MGKLQDKVVIITGGAGGIGSGMAKAMAKEGAVVTIVDLNAEAGEVMAKETTQNDILKYATSFENKLGSQSQNNKEE